MAKVSFPFAVKYGEHFYASHEVLDVAESEVDKLVAMGAKALPQGQKTTEKPFEAKPAKLATKKTYKVPAPAKKEK